jgi:two-component system response regulator HydG
VKDKASILLVDDEAGALETLRDVLTDLGYQVEVAADDLKAVEKARSQAFNTILMDIKMPKLNGVEAYKAIKRHQPETAVIMMTGYPRQTQDLANQAIGKRAHTCLYKPFDMEKAITLIAEARRMITSKEVNHPDK